MEVLSGSKVTLVDHMGDDYRVLEAARVSTGAEARKGDDKDRKLIQFLWKQEHGTPFEQVVFTFKVKTPIFVARQIFRHRISSFNEMSGRYRELPTVFFMPDEFRAQNKEGNKQGSVIDPSINQDMAASLVIASYDEAEQTYKSLLAMGVANELARIVLPVGIYTEFYWTINFRSLANFLHLRLDPHAQPEIQDVALQIEEIVKPLIPWIYEAFELTGKAKA